MNSVSMNADTGEKTWLTPRWMLDRLGAFDLDPCCPPAMPWATARRMVCQPDNGLGVPWYGRIWLNPPYGREALPFFQKMIRENCHGVALVFVRTDNQLWHEYIFPYASRILFLRHRVRFFKPDGTVGNYATAPSALIAYGEADARVLESCGIEGSLR